jgi:hypothetical protein
LARPCHQFAARAQQPKPGAIAITDLLPGIFVLVSDRKASLEFEETIYSCSRSLIVTDHP